MWTTITCAEISYTMPSVSSLISWFSLIGLGSGAVLISSNYFYSMDLLAMSMVWLTVGGTLVAFMSSSFSRTALWWWAGLACVLGFSTFSLVFFFIMFELSIIPILLMLVLWGSQPERMSAGMYFLIYTVSFSTPFLVILVSVWWDSDFLMKKMSHFMGGWVLSMSMLPFLVKMPVFGLHFWLPKAHVEASTSGSMILAGLLLKLGSYGLVRIASFTVISSLSSLWLFSALLASMVTFSQSDNKKLIAYSSVTHMTLLAVAPFSSMKFILLSTIMVSLAHGWTSSGMFLVGGSLSHSSHSRMVLLSWGEAKFSKIIMLMGLLLVSNASIPPFPSFFPEVYLILSLLTMEGALVGGFILLSVSVCYYNTLLFISFTQKKPFLSKSGSSLKGLLSDTLLLNLFNTVSLFLMAYIL